MLSTILSRVVDFHNKLFASILGWLLLSCVGFIIVTLYDAAYAIEWPLLLVATRCAVSSLMRYAIATRIRRVQWMWPVCSSIIIILAFGSDKFLDTGPRIDSSPLTTRMRYLLEVIMFSGSTANIIIAITVVGIVGASQAISLGITRMMSIIWMSAEILGLLFQLGIGSLITVYMVSGSYGSVGLVGTDAKPLIVPVIVAGSLGLIYAVPTAVCLARIRSVVSAQ